MNMLFVILFEDSLFLLKFMFMLGISEFDFIVLLKCLFYLLFDEDVLCDLLMLF